MFKFSSLLLGSAAIVFNQLPVNADTAPGLVNTLVTKSADQNDFRYRKYQEGYKTKILSNFKSSPAPEGFTLLFRVDKSGSLHDASVFDTSHNQHFNLAAIEALLTSFPLVAPPSGETLTSYDNLLPGRVDFKPEKVEKAKTNKLVQIHLIPLEVLNRYPKAFRREELESSQNKLVSTIQLPLPPYKNLPGTSNDHSIESVIGKELASFFAAWRDFFSKHKVASKDELTSYGNSLLDKFKNLKKVGAP